MKKYLLLGAALAVAAVFWLHDRNAKPTRVAAPVAAGLNEPAGPAGNLQPRDAAGASTVADVDDGTETVLGLRVRKDRNCTVELRDYVTPDGDMFAAYTCTPHAPRPRHPYASYSDETLEVMAYSDAEAASLLGKRLIERDAGRSYEMLIRAAALDNDHGHLAWLADQAFGTIRVDGEPQVENLKRQYELAAVARHLGDISGRTALIRDALLASGASADDFVVLDRRVADLLQSMRDIQRNVYGEITVGGRSDA